MTTSSVTLPENHSGGSQGQERLYFRFAQSLLLDQLLGQFVEQLFAELGGLGAGGLEDHPDSMQGLFRHRRPF